MNNNISASVDPRPKVARPVQKTLSINAAENFRQQIAGEFERSGSTPNSNTGCVRPAYQLAMSVGWVSITFFSKTAEDLLDRIAQVKSLFSSVFMDEFIDRCPSPVHYSSAEKSSLGAILAYNLNVNYFSIILNETFCKLFTVSDLLESIQFLRSGGGRLSRFDLTIDDFSRTLDLDYLYNSFFSGELQARFAEINRIKGFSKKTGSCTGDTVYFGKRDSDFCSRIYDKNLDSDGLINSIRWEMEVKNKLADPIFAYVYSSSFPLSLATDGVKRFSLVDFRNAITEVLLTRYDFKDRSTATRISRCKRSEWFQQFVNSCDKAILLIPHKVATIVKTINYVRDQVSTSLALLREYFGDKYNEFIELATYHGWERLKPKHLARLPNPV